MSESAVQILFTRPSVILREYDSDITSKGFLSLFLTRKGYALNWTKSEGLTIGILQYLNIIKSNIIRFLQYITTH